ncbi:hypothetical protein NAEGRDRAFT_79241 [Naegleria gruberi]|uniref:Uncharacterized protein n=1 Tax=Naegleria gruberi TaxID=5762 RepID=D2VAQ8_NAEGR|nr:uncharacterized protein NAEGRDRAFT_79241 [Naegleria gruberi]EFC45994.1 hypothetical protein NAEGRDRAFT_79241 [Naegleria gruberi]|eukprot:XP_002678738.1 hypothetical protein NAEGRDRAFT_79241 [Naegleria gruberi strain NEG-M]
MTFHAIHEIPKIDIDASTSYMSIYDVEIVNDRDLMIFGTNSYLHFYHLTTRLKLKSVQLTDYVSDVHELVVDGCYLYLTSGSRLFKYNLDSLLNIDDNKDTKEALIWESLPNVLSNCWGLALLEMGLKKYAFVMDYGEGILVFDTATGNRVEMKMPRITTGYGIAFTDTKEMLISTSNNAEGPIQLFTYNPSNMEWEKTREVNRDASMNFNTPYGICYEKRTQLIYLMDTFAKAVFVFRKQDMVLVQKWELNQYLSAQTLYGISLNPKKGELFLPVCDHSVIIMK